MYAKSKLDGKTGTTMQRGRMELLERYKRQRQNERRLCMEKAKELGVAFEDQPYWQIIEAGKARKEALKEKPDGGGERENQREIEYKDIFTECEAYLSHR